MPFPFMQMPTFGHFRSDLASRWGCTYKSMGNGANGKPFRYIERVVGGIAHTAVVDHDDSDVLAPDVMRSILTRLGLKPADFGLDM